MVTGSRCVVEELAKDPRVQAPTRHSVTNVGNERN
jgi:hypothetical protein